MKLPGRLRWLTFLFLFPALVVTGQTYRFRHLTNAEGLSQNSVNCILQDSKGFMWFGTQDGLNRFDGYNFVVYRQDPADEYTLTHSWVWDVFEDSRGDLWIATWRGLTRYDPHTDRFIRFLPDTADPGSISGERPAAVCEDKAGNIWIAIWGGGLNRYDTATGKFTRFLADPENRHSLPGNFVREVFCDSRGCLWVGTWSGLARVENPEDSVPLFTRFVHKEEDPATIGGNRIMKVMEDHAGKIWIATRGGGLNLFREEDSSFIRYRYDKKNPRSISSDDVCSLFEDSRHRYWVGTFTEGLNLFDPEQGTFVRIYHDPDDPASIGSNNVYSISEDRSGLVWIGAGGLNILDDRINRFGHYSHREKDPHSLSNNYVVSFYEDGKGLVWIGTEGGGLNRFDPQKGRFISYRHRSADPRSIAGNNVSAVTGNGSGDLWVAARGAGLDRFDPATGRFTHITAMQGLSAPEQEGLKYINDMCFAPEHVLWIATDNVGLIRYDLTKKRAITFNSGSRSGGNFPGNALLTLWPDTKGVLWIGTWGIGLYSMDMKNFHFISYPADEKDTLAIAGNIVHVIRETTDTSGRRIWVGTSKGLSYMDPDQPGKPRFRRLTLKEGLPSNIIYGVLRDNLGRVWMSTNRGISRYDPVTKQIRNFDVNDGLQSNEFNGHACLKLRNGSLMFGGVNGFNMFQPGQIRESTYEPPVVLTSFKVFNREMKFDKDLQEVKKIILSWKQNFFSFEFAALDYTHPARLKYAYRMEGVDKDWIFSGSRRYASYTNISPGDYAFRVKGTNCDGVWSSHVLTIEVTIRPPYWKTWWFRMLEIILFLLVLYGLHHMQLQKLLAVERLRVRIASDLHDDVGSALTRISIASEQLQTTKDRNRMISLAKTIGDISRDIISTMSDIIWSIDARNDTLDQLTDRMQDFVYTAFSMKDIKVEFRQQGMRKKKKIPVDYRQNIFYIFKEVINNIVKHANATVVTINLKNTERGFVMDISDNGKGFDPEQVKKGNGLKNIRMRAERLKAKLEVHTDQGVRIVLRMKRL